MTRKEMLNWIYENCNSRDNAKHYKIVKEKIVNYNITNLIGKIPVIKERQYIIVNKGGTTGQSRPCCTTFFYLKGGKYYEFI